jgi:hypothetical protein
MRKNLLAAVALLALPLAGCYATHPWPDQEAFASLRVTFES